MYPFDYKNITENKSIFCSNKKININFVAFLKERY
jgi:hypothetical protein